MRRWTLTAAAAALLAAAFWHLPAIAQRAAPAAVTAPAVPQTLAATAPAVNQTVAAPVPAPAQTASAPAAVAKPATTPAAGSAAAPELITFDEYRDFRMRYIEESRARLTHELAATNLTAAQRASFERRKAYYDRQAAMPAAERDAMFHARFDEIDTDHDGTIDSAERAAWRQKQREHYRELAAERTQRTAAAR
jgi:hypothetical protein